MFTKIMMARMNSLEEGFREVIHEMRDHMRHDEQRSASRGRVGKAAPKEKKLRDKERERPMTAGADKENLNPQAGYDGQEDAVVEKAQSARGANDERTMTKGGAHDRPTHERASSQ
jgi:hypothetical protein